MVRLVVLPATRAVCALTLFATAATVICQASGAGLGRRGAGFSERCIRDLRQRVRDLPSTAIE